MKRLDINAKAQLKEWKKDKMETGTTIMAVTYKGGVIMGADSRATSGAFVANRVTDKLHPIHKRIFCCRSGSSAHTQAVADYTSFFLDFQRGNLYPPMERSVDMNLPKVRTAAHVFQDMCYSMKGFLSASIICGGWDPIEGGSVFSIPLGGSLVQEPFCLGGSGSIYIYGYCDNNFRKGFTKEECINFVVKGLSLAMARDGSSGGIIRYIVIDKDGAEKFKILPKDFPKQYTE